MDKPLIDILIVDDLKDNQVLMEIILENDEYNILIANNGFEAVSLSLENDIAVILMDVQMPSMDGYEAAKLIKKSEKSKFIPIIYITANAIDNSQIFKGYDTGAVDYIFKPFDAEILKSKVRVFVEIFKKNKEIQLKNNQLERLNNLLLEKNQTIEEKKKKLENALSLIEIKTQELTSKNKDFLDSIMYAKRIQQSFFQNESTLRNYLTDFFIFFRAKDILSGDFYWVANSKNKEGQNKTFVAVADCTGHGVPGALLSIVGYNILAQKLQENQDFSPGELLESLNREIIHLFNQTAQSRIKDGMDISIISLDFDNHQLVHAGANQVSYLVRNNELIEFKPDKQSIGYDEKFLKEMYMLDKIDIDEYTDNYHFQSIHKIFQNKSISFQRGDKFYLFTDGFADQFGGSKGKKMKYKGFRELILNISKLNSQDSRIFLRNYVEEWKNGLEQVDDILVFGIYL